MLMPSLIIINFTPFSRTSTDGNDDGSSIGNKARNFMVLDDRLILTAITYTDENTDDLSVDNMVHKFIVLSKH